MTEINAPTPPRIMPFFNEDIAWALAGMAELASKGGPVYLATPYTRYLHGQEEAARRASAYAGEFIACTLPTFSPIAHGHAIANAAHIDPSDVDFWVAANEAMLRASSSLIVVKMDGWQESKGVAIEIAAFEKAGKPILYLPEDFFLDYCAGGRCEPTKH